MYTYYNSVNGYESQPNDLSDELDVTEPEPTTDDERTNFLAMGSQITQAIGSSNSPEAKLDTIKCALDKYTYTIQELVDYVDAMDDEYANADGDTPEQVVNDMDCLTTAMPEIYETNPSYMGVVTNVKKCLATSSPIDQQLLCVGCTVSDTSRCEELYGPSYHQMVDDIVVILNSTVPPEAYLPEDEWKVAQINCIVNGDIEEATAAVYGKQILVSDIQPSSDAQVDTIRLYRIGGTLSTYNLVEELPASATSYLDNKADADIAGSHILDSFVNGIPPQDGKYFSEANSMLYLAVGEKLYFSEVAKPYAWPPVNYIDFDMDITGIGNVQNGLLVFTRYKTYIVTGTSPEMMSKFIISAEQGCINHDTIVFVENSLFWLSTDGVCTSSGGHVGVVTQDALGRLFREDSINAWQHDRMYFLALSDKIIILDNRYGLCVRELNYTGFGGVFKDEAYIKQDDGLLHKLFDGEYESMFYRSPLYQISRYSEYKVFKDFYIAFEGQIHIMVYLHTHDKPKELVLDKELNQAHMRRNMKCKPLAGYAVSFEISGTGKVYEREFDGIVWSNWIYTALSARISLVEAAVALV